LDKPGISLVIFFRYTVDWQPSNLRLAKISEDWRGLADKTFLILLDFVVGLFLAQTIHEFARIHE
jgi:hypothetical protein